MAGGLHGVLARRGCWAVQSMAWPWPDTARLGVLTGLWGACCVTAEIPANSGGTAGNTPSDDCCGSTTISENNTRLVTDDGFDTNIGRCGVVGAGKILPTIGAVVNEVGFVSCGSE